MVSSIFLAVSVSICQKPAPVDFRPETATSETLSHRSRMFSMLRCCFDFLKFRDAFGCARIRSDAFGCVRMCSYAFGCTLIHSDAFGHFFETSGKFRVVLDNFGGVVSPWRLQHSRRKARVLGSFTLPQTLFITLVYLRTLYG